MQDKLIELADALADATGRFVYSPSREGLAARICAIDAALVAYRAEREKPVRSWDGYAVWQDGAEFPDYAEATELETKAHYADEDYDTTPEQIEKAFAKFAAKYGLSIIPVRVTERSE